MNIERTIDIVTIGRSSIDLYSQDIGVAFEEITGFSAYVGGGPVNVAVGAHRLGLTAHLVTGVGTDKVGDFIVHFLKKEGLDLTGIKKVPHGRSSAVLLGIEPPDRFPLTYYRDNAADWFIDRSDIDRIQFDKVKYLVINGTALARAPSCDAVAYAAQQAHNQGVKVLLDLDYRADQWNGPSDYAKAIAAVLALVDVVIGTQEEIIISHESGLYKHDILDHQMSAPQISGDIDAALQTIVHQVNGVIMKEGALGASWITGEGSQSIAGYPVDVVNVLGAGDAFMSGVVYGLCQGWTMTEAIKYGNACGAILVTQPGCSNFSPSLGEVEAFIDSYI